MIDVKANPLFAQSLFYKTACSFQFCSLLWNFLIFNNTGHNKRSKDQLDFISISTVSKYFFLTIIFWQVQLIQNGLERSQMKLLVSCQEGLVGKWADPSGTAILGQPVTKPEQAPQLHPLSKISLISKGTHGPRIRY